MRGQTDFAFETSLDVYLSFPIASIPGMPSTLHPTGPADYLSLAEQHQHNQSDSGSLHRSHGYLFTGLVLLLPIVRSHVRDKDHGSERPEDGLVMGTRKKKDIKGKGKMNHDQASRSDLIKGEDMIVLVSFGRV